MTERKEATGTESAAIECRGTCNLQAQHCSNPNTPSVLIIEELNRIYEDRLRDIDEQAKGDLKLKTITYKEWVDMLIRVMRYLLETLNDLETEAINRVALLERKLAVECRMDHNGEIGQLKSDLANLLELIRRAIEERKWNVDGLEFQTINLKDIFGDTTDKCDLAEMENEKKLSSQIICQNQQLKRLESEKNALKTELDMKELQLRKLNTNKCTKCKVSKPDEHCAVVVAAPTDTEDKVFKACIVELKEVLKEKETQLADTLKENECLKSELRIVKGQVVQKEKHCECCQRAQSPGRRSPTLDSNPCFQSIPGLRCSPLPDSNLDFQRISSPVRGSTPSPPQPRLNSTPVIQNEIIPFCQYSEPLTFRSEYSEISSGSDHTMDTIVVLEYYKLNACQVEEAQQMTNLQMELDELFQVQFTHNQTVEEQRKMVTWQQRKLKQLIQRLLCDLSQARNKLTFVRKQLMLMSSSHECDQSGEDSGYTSQEDMEPECSILTSVKGRIQCLKDENHELKCKIQQLQCDIQSARSSATNCGKIIKEVTSVIANMSRKEIPCDLNNEEYSPVHPLCEAVMCLETDLIQKDKQIEELTKSEEHLGKQLQHLQSKNCVLVHEADAKEQTIFDLQQTIAFQNNSIQLLQRIKGQLEAELVAFKQTACSLERMIVNVRDENLYLKDLLVDYEADYQHLEQKHLEITDDVEHLRSENVDLKSFISQKDLKYDELSCKYQVAIQMLQQQKARCRCPSAQNIKLDGKEVVLPPSKRPQDLQHIFEMLDRKNEEIKAIKEYSCEEKNRLTKAILELEEQVKQIQIKTSLLEKTLDKREEDLRQANKKLMESAKQDGELAKAILLNEEQVLILQAEEDQLKKVIEQLSEELSESKVIRREREGCLMADVNALRKSLDEQSKALAKANETIINMERQTNAYRKQGDAANKEVRECYIESGSFWIEGKLGQPGRYRKKLTGTIEQNSGRTL